MSNPIVVRKIDDLVFYLKHNDFVLVSSLFCFRGGRPVVLYDMDNCGDDLVKVHCLVDIVDVVKLLCSLALTAGLPEPEIDLVLEVREAGAQKVAGICARLEKLCNW